MKKKNINTVIAELNSDVKKSIFDKINELDNCVQEMHNI